MDSKITINIVEPGSAPVVPDTGLFTAGIGGPEATIITAVSAVLLLTIVAVVVAMLYKKHKKQGKATKLVNTVDACAAIAKSKKRVSAGLAAVALLVSAGTFATLLVNAGKNNTNAAEGEDGLTLDVSSEDLTIEVGSEPVFAVLPVKVSVEEATQAGYTLTAFAESTDLVSTTDESKTIPMIAVDEGELAALTDNTYGLTLAEPASQDEEVYTALSTDADNPTLLAEKEEGTGADDKTTIYYGFYITPDTPYGTYTSGDVYYNVEENSVPATVVFNGKGLYFNGDKDQTTNTMKYTVVTTDRTEQYSHTPNIDNAGTANGPVKFSTQVNEIVSFSGATKLHVKYTYGGGYNPGYSRLEGFGSFWEGAHADYTPDTKSGEGIPNCGGGTVADGKYYANDGTNVTVECDVPGDTVTFGYWTSGGGPGSNAASYGYYAVVTGYDANGNIIYLLGNNPVSGTYLTPASDSYYRFLGWSEQEDAVEPTYVTEEDIENELTVTPGTTTQLYAVWQEAFTISYDGNGADSATGMSRVEQYTADVESESKSVDLLASNFTREGYGFAGWSTDKDAASKINSTGNDKPTIYGPNQTITVNPSTSTKLNLYAVWVPAETSVTMQTFNPNSEPYASKLKGTVIALKDERDEEVYTVAKLADGKYWMVENLRLDSDATISTTNTNNPIVEEGTTNVAIKNNDGNTSNHLSPTTNDWCKDSNPACIDQSNLNTNNVANAVISPVFSQDFTSEAHRWDTGSLDANIISYGSYYNWYSSTAGQGTRSVSSGNATGDICPTGWQLPSGGNSSSTGGGNTKGGFHYLNQQMGGGTSATDSNNWRSFPNNFVYSGLWSGSSAGNRGNSGLYWSSTALNNDDAYYLYLGSDNVNSDGNSNKKNGFSVRCVAPVQ